MSTSRNLNSKTKNYWKLVLQEGYGAFSYSKQELQNVIHYINNQPIHHGKKTFIEEYLEMLNEFEIDYDDRYVFKPVGIDYIVPDGT